MQLKCKLCSEILGTLGLVGPHGCSVCVLIPYYTTGRSCKINTFNNGTSVQIEQKLRTEDDFASKGSQW